MEGLLILIGIYVLEIIVKKVIAKKSNSQEASQPTEERPDDSYQNRRQGSLQDLIRQFEEAQRESSQGTFTPPTPPVEDVPEDFGNMEEKDFDEMDDEDVDSMEKGLDGESEQEDNQVELPVVTPANQDHLTFNEIAESVIQWEEVSVGYLQQAFGFSETTAKQVLADLQARRIAGRDMGEGFCDILVHDKVELANLFKQEQREAEEHKAAEELQSRRDTEMEHQKELNDLEERARQAREQAQQTGIFNPAEDSDSAAESTKIKKRDFNIAEVRRGFVWAKVIDEPRFKKRWSARVR